MTALQLVILEALRHDAGDLEPAGVAELAAGVAEAAAGVQAAAVESLMRAARASWRLGRRHRPAHRPGQPALPPARDRRRRWRSHKRYDQPFALLVLDVDGLRRVNDSQGHPGGRPRAGPGGAGHAADDPHGRPRRADRRGRVLRARAREQRRPARTLLAERLAEAVAARSSTPTAPASGSRSAWWPARSTARTLSALLEAADGAMYRAKAGGEAVAVANPEPRARDHRETQYLAGGPLTVLPAPGADPSVYSIRP